MVSSTDKQRENDVDNTVLAMKPILHARMQEKDAQPSLIVKNGFFLQICLLALTVWKKRRIIRTRRIEGRILDMLVSFRFSNCRSFYDETEFSMRATRDVTYKEINTFSVNEEIMEKADNEIIKSAVIFGANASGKSNVLKAFTYMANVVRLSSAQIPIVSANENFAFKLGAEEEKSLYEVEIVTNGVFFKYGFELRKGCVEREWLYKREKRLTPVFKRDGESLKIMDVDEQSLKLIKIPSSALFLSIGNNFNLVANKYLKEVMGWFLRALIVFEDTSNSVDIYTVENSKYKEQALEILKKADIGIYNFQIVKDKIATATDPTSILTLNSKIQNDPTILSGQLKAETENLYRMDMKTEFKVFDDKGNPVGEKNVMLFKERGFNSEGTVRLICYLGWILAALDQGRVIFIDEIDSKLHFLVADYILKLFNSIENNPKNAQLICTAHNVMLMDDNLRRDQIYFTSKDEMGRSYLASLADYTGVRKNDLFSKKYLAGFYATLPDFCKERE